MRKLVLALFGLVLLSGLAAAEAQTPTNVREVDGYPFTKRIMNSKEEYARAVETCDQDLLYADCNQMAAVANNLWSLGLVIPPDNEAPTSKAAKFVTARQELARWMRRLEERPCPQSVSTTLARAVQFSNGWAIEREGTRRRMKPGETCLVDTNNAKVVMSLTCGNFITGELPFIFTGGGEATQSAAARSDEAATPAANGTVGITQQEMRQAIQDALEQQQRATGDQAKETTSSRSNQSASGKSWLSRNKSWLIPTAAVAIGGGICAATRCWASDVEVTNSTVVTVR